MDRPIFYRAQLPLESDVLGIARGAYEGLGLFALDVLGEDGGVAGFPCIPTSPASLAVLVGAGRFYKTEFLDPTAYGVRLSTGGLPADVDPDHTILKQGLWRDEASFATPAPATGGHSIKYLIQVRFESADDAATPISIYNVLNPNAPISDTLSQMRRDKAIVSIKAGTSHASPTAPSPDAGNVPLWVVTVANGDTSVTAPDIVEADGAPFIEVGGGGGGGGGLDNWQEADGVYTAVSGDRIFADTSGGPFTITLPATPSPGAEVWFIGDFATNNLTVARNGQTIRGDAENTTLDEDDTGAHFVFMGGTWRVSNG